MVERFYPILKLICLALAALVLYQILRLAMRKDPLESLSFLATPSLLASSEPPKIRKETNYAQSLKGMTNEARTNAATNHESRITNHATLRSNAPAITDGRATGRATSVASRQLRGPGGMAAPKAAELPPAVQARVDNITQSEILGMVVRPLPMALLGIGGRDAFIRAPNGQTGLLREGEELGGIKLLRIGTNRVLIEHEQQQKELMLFSGFGGDPLLPKGKANPQ